MFTTKQYRAKAVEYGELVKTSIDPNQRRDFQKIEQSFTALADNEQWLADNYRNTLHASDQDPNGATLAEEEEHILRCLGAALIMQWNTLPAKLQRELFDNAGSMGDLLDAPAPRGQIARFLHKHKEDEGMAAPEQIPLTVMRSYTRRLSRGGMMREAPLHPFETRRA